MFENPNYSHTLAPNMERRSEQKKRLLLWCPVKMLLVFNNPQTMAAKSGRKENWGIMQV